MADPVSKAEALVPKFKFGRMLNHGQEKVSPLSLRRRSSS